MRKEYDFSKSKKNPYAKHLKQQVTIRLIEYFKTLAEESGIAYQVLINLFLRECATTHKKPVLRWSDAG